MNQTIGVNITPQSFQPTLHYSQGDVGRVFVVNVTDYDIPSGATVTCVATKPSGMGFTVSGTVSGNTVTFTSTAEMTDEWGRFPAEIRIASGSTLLGTANFLMIGEKDPHPASTIDGTQEELIPQLTLLVNRVEAAAESVHDLTVSATTLTAGSDATATYDSTNNSITFGIPRGADGDVTRSEFNDLKSDTNNINNQIYEAGENKYLYSEADEWRLTSSGLSESNADYHILKFEVSVGELLYIETPDKFQFQTGVNVPSSGASPRIGKTYTANGFYTVPSGTAPLYLIVSAPKNGLYVCKTAFKKIAEINKLRKAVDELDGAFDTEVTSSEMNAFQSGCIDNEGNAQENVAYSYTSLSITDEDAGKTFYISGDAWYAIKPYVFVGNTETLYPNIPYASTATHYSELAFSPTEAGTLYVNKYQTQPASVQTKSIGTIKDSHLGISALDYEQVSLTLVSGKLLDATNGVVTESSGESYYVSNFTEVTPNSLILLSTEHFYGQGMYVLYDENQIYIKGVASNSGATITKLRNEIIRVPSNAKYIRVGFLYQASFTEPSLFQGGIQSINPSKVWENKKWACIGDSLTESYGVTNIHYFEYISAITGINTVNLGASGNGYAQGANNFRTKGLLVPSDSDVVTIFGSGNDASSGLPLGDASDSGVDTIAGCINTTIDNVFSINPIIPLGIITPTPWENNMPYDNGWMETYSNLIVEICKRRSIPCLDLYHCSNLDPNNAAVRSAAYSKDNGGGVHPNERGHYIIATHINAFLHSLLLSY